VQGTVLLQAVISKEGSIENLIVISGHPLLLPAALDAVSRWRYEPTSLNGVPVEVETTVEVRFKIGN
jgi:protein TonB